MGFININKVALWQFNNIVVLNAYPVDAQVSGQSLALAKFSTVKDEDGGWPSCGDEVSLFWMPESSTDLWLQQPTQMCLGDGGLWGQSCSQPGQAKVALPCYGDREMFSGRSLPETDAASRGAAPDLCRDSPGWWCVQGARSSLQLSAVAVGGTAAA